jgi:predicted branched-subunit amino acid permease
MTHEVLQHCFFVFSIVVLVAGSLFWSFLESVITQLFCFFVTPGWRRESLLESVITQLFCFFVTPGWHRESLLESVITQLFCFVWIFGFFLFNHLQFTK